MRLNKVKTYLQQRAAFKKINTEFIKMCKLLVAFKSHLCPENMFKKPNKQNKTKTSNFTHLGIKVQVFFPGGKNLINFDIPQINIFRKQNCHSADLLYSVPWLI